MGTVLITLILAAAVIGIGVLFWDNIVDFIKKIHERIKRTLKKATKAVSVFMKKMKEGYEEITVQFFYTGDHWEKFESTRKVPESEVPPEIRNRIYENQETDITDELESELKKLDLEV